MIFFNKNFKILQNPIEDKIKTQSIALQEQKSGGSKTFLLQNKIAKYKRKIMLLFDQENYVIKEYFSSHFFFYIYTLWHRKSKS